MQEIKISKDKPEIYTRLNEKFGVEWNDGVIICYGDTLHCKYDMPPEKIVHEMVHIKQQEKIGKELWWELYLSNESFRLEQEVEAYRSEYKFIKENIKDRNQRFNFLYEMSRNLSSKQYGSICSFSEAMRLIQQ